MNTVLAHASGFCEDPAMPFMRLALDREYMEREFRRLLGAEAVSALGAIRVVRWKPGRRSVIEYEVGGTDGGNDRRTLIGKVRAKSLDETTFRLASRLSARARAGDGTDGPSVPPVVGAIPECHMWLQEKVTGISAWDALTGPDGARAARAIGGAIAKLQRSFPPLVRRHTIEDEMAHLRARLAAVSASRPEWAPRIWQVLAACERLAVSARSAEPSGVHRDFYHDQVIVGSERIWLLDLDLAAESDPALDVGNFSAHLVEQSLRLLGGPDALARQEAEFVEGYVEAGGRGEAASIATYKALSLARHIYLRTTFEERRPHTEALLRLCEQRLPC